MAITLKNAILLHLDPIKVETGDLRIDGDSISHVGNASADAADDVVDCRRCVVMPALSALPICASRGYSSR